LSAWDDDGEDSMNERWRQMAGATMVLVLALGPGAFAGPEEISTTVRRAC